MNKIAIFGAGGFGREVKWLISEINKKDPAWEFIGFFDDDFSKASNIPVNEQLGGSSILNQWKEPLKIVFAIGNPVTKKKIISKISNDKLSFPELIHPNVLIGHDVSIGAGSIICAGCIITSNIKIGQHVILNLGCTVGHDTEIGNYSSFMPSVNISGEVCCGEGVYTGTGAKIINQLSIGDETTIGAGAVVAKSLPSGCTAVGVPAKIIRHNPA